MACKHEYQEGKALLNLATNNGKNYDMDKVGRGEGLYPGAKVRTVLVHKCIHCGHSRVVDSVAPYITI